MTRGGAETSSVGMPARDWRDSLTRLRRPRSTRTAQAPPQQLDETKPWREDATADVVPWWEAPFESGSAGDGAGQVQHAEEERARAHSTEDEAALQSIRRGASTRRERPGRGVGRGSRAGGRSVCV